jgi:hypothetical protein
MKYHETLEGLWDFLWEREDVGLFCGIDSRNNPTDISHHGNSPRAILDRNRKVVYT